jgi:DNA-binding MarR family transcriptional regulator
MEPTFKPRTTLRRPAISPLDTHLCYWLRCVAHEISNSLSRQLEDKGVTLAEWIMLRELYDGDRRPTALAEKLGLTRGAISRLARRLAACLTITQETTTGDGRCQMLALTDQGRAIVTVLAVALDNCEMEFFGHLDAETRALMTAVLREIVRPRGLRAPPAE